MLLNKLAQLKSHQGFLRYFKNTSWMAFESGLRILASFLVGIWVARYLGPEEFGLFSYVIAYTALFVSVAKLGLDDIVKRELVKAPDKYQEYLGTAFWLKTAGAFLALLFIALSLPLTSNSTLTNFYILIISAGLVFQSFEVIEFYFVSQVKAKVVTICKAIQLALSSIIKIYLILSQADLIWFVYVALFDTVTLAVSYLVAFKKQDLGSFLYKFDTKLAKRFLYDSWPLIIVSTSFILQGRIDQVMLKEMAGNALVGYYSASVRLIEAVSFIPVVLRSSLYPAIVSSKEYSSSLYQSRLLNFYRLHFILFLIIAIPVFFMADKIILLLFGEAYEPAGVLLALLSVRIFFTNMAFARGSFLLTENLVKYSLVSALIGTIVNVLFNLKLIPVFGAMGAIVATIISFSVTIFVCDLIYSKTRKNALSQLNSILTFYKINIRDRRGY